jgi:hypothetical protein
MNTEQGPFLYRDGEVDKMTGHTGRTLLVGLCLGLGLWGCERASSASTAGGNTAAPASAPTSAGQVSAAQATPDQVVVYYFHNTRRCRTCLGIQAAIDQTIKERFAADTASGRLQFVEVNVDEPQHAHYVQEFGLSFSSMVVAAKQGLQTVKWENADKVWEHAHDQAALASYAEQRIRSFLELLPRT